jgi:hypothetical protein
MNSLFAMGMRILGKSPVMKMDPQLFRSMQKPLDGIPRNRFKNPGFHVQSDFITDTEEMALLKETAFLKEKYSFIAGEPIRVYTKDVKDMKKGVSKKDMKKQLEKQSGIDIIPRRVTGRPENGNTSPWGYGNTFDENGVLPELKKVVNRIQSHYEKFHSGPKVLRDITINYRDFGMFRLDPHVVSVTISHPLNIDWIVLTIFF